MMGVHSPFFFSPIYLYISDVIIHFESMNFRRVMMDWRKHFSIKNISNKYFEEHCIASEVPPQNGLFDFSSILVFTKNVHKNRNANLFKCVWLRLYILNRLTAFISYEFRNTFLVSLRSDATLQSNALRRVSWNAVRCGLYIKRIQMHPWKAFQRNLYTKRIWLRLLWSDSMDAFDFWCVYTPQ